MSVLNVRDALLAVLPRVYHYTAPVDDVDSGERYAVWGETGIATLGADDGPAEWAITGMVYFYTPVEYDEIFQQICASLCAYGVAIRPGRIGYDDTRKEIAYELEWSVESGPFEIYQEHIMTSEDETIVAADGRAITEGM